MPFDRQGSALPPKKRTKLISVPVDGVNLRVVLLSAAYGSVPAAGADNRQLSRWTGCRHPPASLTGTDYSVFSKNAAPLTSNYLAEKDCYQQSAACSAVPRPGGARSPGSKRCKP